MTRPLQGLYAITDSTLLAGGKLLPYVESALRGGARLIQYRDKSTDDARRRDEAETLRDLCQHYGADLIINDDTELAAQLGVGLHLGQEDGSVAAARALLGPQAIIGATCHASLALAEQAMQSGATYLAFGRFFPSQTKPGAPQATPELLAMAKARVSQPLVAIGGITHNNAVPLIHQGANMVAVVHALFSAPTPSDVEYRARVFNALFKEI